MRVKKIPIKQVVNEIVAVNRYIANFWQDGGWAQGKAAKLLSESRLDRQVSLSKCLKIWLRNPPKGEEDGRLILGWANLGTLIEGSMKFFLCVFAHDYANSPVVDHNKKTLEPDGLMIERLRQYFLKTVWTDHEKRRWGPFVEMVQQRRNGIHAYKHRDIGDRKEFKEAIRTYLEFVDDINKSVPYPEG